MNIAKIRTLISFGLTDAQITQVLAWLPTTSPEPATHWAEKLPSIYNGMNPDGQPSVRADATIKHIREQAGLGLYDAKQVVDYLSGRNPVHIHHMSNEAYDVLQQIQSAGVRSL